MMYCNNCGKELKEGAKFCDNCDSKVYNISTIEKDKESIREAPENQQQKNKKIRISLKKMIIISIISIILLVILVFYIKNIIFKKTDLPTSQSFETSSIQEENKKTIPENKKAIVTFVENGIELKEEKEVDRESLLSCVNNVIVDTDSKLRETGAGVVKYKVLLYYVEYDIMIDNKTIHKNEYGAMMNSNVVAQNLNSIYAQNYYYRLVTKFSNVTPMLQVVKRGNQTRNEQFLSNDVVVSRETYFQDIKDSLESGCKNIRVGAINANDNEWVKVIFNKKEESNEEKIGDEDVTANDEMRNLYQENNSNNENINNTNIDLESRTSNNSSVQQEKYLEPVINANVGIKKDKLIIKYSIGDNYDDAVNVIIKHNGISVMNDKKIIGVNQEYTETIQVSEGTHKIEISATNSKGKTCTEVFTKEVKYSAPVLNVYDLLERTQREQIGIICFVTDDYSEGVEKNIHLIIKNNENIIADTYVMSKVWEDDRYIISLSEGINTIEIIATNSKGKTSTKQYTVIRETES